VVLKVKTSNLKEKPYESKPLEIEKNEETVDVEAWYETIESETSKVPISTSIPDVMGVKNSVSVPKEVRERTHENALGKKR